ncbi:MAG TPA: hypothetical protein VEY33_09935 [Gemmatimonadota bacterium]|nr:hypothetical protein [Gemmatimonadota bacterium]
MNVWFTSARSSSSANDHRWFANAYGPWTGLLEDHERRAGGPFFRSEEGIGAHGQLERGTHTPDRYARLGRGEESREQDVAHPERRLPSRDEGRLAEDRDDHASDQVPVLPHRERHHGLEVEQEAGVFVGPDPAIPVELKRNADQARHRIRKLLGERAGVRRGRLLSHGGRGLESEDHGEAKEFLESFHESLGYNPNGEAKSGCDARVAVRYIHSFARFTTGRGSINLELYRWSRWQCAD